MLEKRAAAPAAAGSYLFCDLRLGCQDIPVGADAQKVAVANFGGSHVRTDEDIDTVVILPEQSGLHFEQVNWRAQRVDDLFFDEVVSTSPLCRSMSWCLLLCSLVAS